MAVSQGVGSTEFTNLIGRKKILTIVWIFVSRLVTLCVEKVAIESKIITKIFFDYFINI